MSKEMKTTMINVPFIPRQRLMTPDEAVQRFAEKYQEIIEAKDRCHEGYVSASGICPDCGADVPDK